MPLRKWFSFAAVALSCFASQASGQVETSLASTPTACLNTAGDVDLSYPVQHRIVNTTSKVLKVKLGRDRSEIFMLFASEKSARPEDAIFQYNPDWVSPPPVVVHRLAAKKALVWQRTVHILIPAHDGDPIGRPAPGRYFVILFPDVLRMDAKGPGGRPELSSGFLPIDIPPTPPPIGVCKKHS